MKRVLNFLLIISLIYIPVTVNAAQGVSKTRTASKWYAVNEAYKALTKQCQQGNLSNISIDTDFAQSTGFVAKVNGNCSKGSTSESFIFWSYDYQKGDPYVNHRADEWIKKVDREISTKICANKGMQVTSLQILSNDNSDTAGKSDFVAIFNASLGFQWIAWKLTCA